MIEKILRVTRRSPLGDVVRRCADHGVVGRQRSCHHRRVDQGPDPDRNIETVIDQIDHAIAQLQLDRNFGIPLQERNERRRKGVRAEGQR